MKSILLKRLLSAAIAVVLVLGCIPLSFGEGTVSGTYGSNLSWTLDENGHLEISGSGSMKDNNTDPISVAWYPYRERITSVTLKEGITSIGHQAFEDCVNLVSVSIPASVTTIESRAFADCTSLPEITIPKKVTCIEYTTFENCTSLSRVVLPKGLKEISLDAFTGCSGLREIDLPEGLEIIDDYAFNGCSGLTSITLPASVTYLGEYAFACCQGLSFAELSSKVDVIRGAAFYGCVNLTQVTLPAGLRIIHPRAFQFCSSLSRISIPSKVTRIDRQAFQYCSSLTEITLPLSLESVGCAAFHGCGSLETALYAGSKAQWKNVLVVDYFPDKDPETDEDHSIPNSNAALKESLVYNQRCAYGHTAVRTGLKKATLTASGCKSHYICSVCGKWFTNAACTNETTKSQRTIPQVEMVKLTKTRYSYDGEIKRPAVEVYDAKGNKLVKDTDYTVSYESGRRLVGKYTVTVKGKGNYSFTKTLHFKIVPPKTTFTYVGPRNKGFGCRWEQQSAQVTGYQLQYSPKEDFSSGVKTVTIADKTDTAKKITGLKSGKTYYVRICTYKTVKGETICSGWSEAAAVKTK